MDAEIHLNYSIQQSSENLPVLSLFSKHFFLFGMHFSGAYSRLMLALIGVFNRVLWILKKYGSIQYLPDPGICIAECRVSVGLKGC